MFSVRKALLEDPDEQYRNDLSVPAHHNPLVIRVAALAPKLKVLRRPGWMDGWMDD